MVSGMALIKHNKPRITEDDIAVVSNVLRSGWLAQGPFVDALESQLVQLYGSGEACAVSSGTAALFLALKSLGAGVGQKIAIPTYACSALLNAIFLVGAEPLVLDVLPDTFCLNPENIIGNSRNENIVIGVDTFGAELMTDSLKAQGLKVIQDCCHSLGGWGEKGPAGATADVAVFSFYATKIITGGQGGMLWAKNFDFVNIARDFREHDCRDEYIPRFNMQLTDIQAALISNQMLRLGSIRAKKSQIANRYLESLPLGLSTQAGVDSPGRMVYRFTVLTPDFFTRKRLAQHMLDNDIECAIPIERHELLHRYLKLDPQSFPVAEHLADTTLSIPIHGCLSEEDIMHICAALRTFSP